MDTGPKNELFENRGKNTEVLLVFKRHGHRALDGSLTDHGREETREKAEKSKLKYNDFLAVKPIGSEAGKKIGAGVRALETAEIFAHGIDPDTIYNTRAQNALSYETLISPVPYDHVAIYNKAYLESLNECQGDKVKAAKTAQKAVLNHSMSLETPEAIAYKREAAGAFAYLIKHYEKVVKRLNEGSKVLLPAGTHGGTMEMLLKYALVQRNEKGEQKVGFTNIDDIGGEFSPSDGYDVDIRTDEEGTIQKLLVEFDENRPVSKDAYLDPVIVDELAEYYESLHFPKENK